MRAVILAGGKGVRLAPLTEVIPKPLVPVAGMPIMEIVIRQLRHHGFRRITIATGYMSDLIKAYFQDGSKFGVKIDYSVESSPLGTAGPLALIHGLEETFLMMNADVLTNLNYRELFHFHQKQKALVTIGAYERQVTIDLGVIVGNGSNRVKDYIEKPKTSHLVSMGVYVFEPGILSFIQKDTYLDFPDLIKILLQAGKTVNYYHFNGHWLDIGRHDDYATAAEEFGKLKDQLNI